MRRRGSIKIYGKLYHSLSGKMHAKHAKLFQFQKMFTFKRRILIFTRLDHSNVQNWLIVPILVPRMAFTNDAQGNSGMKHEFYRSYLFNFLFLIFLGERQNLGGRARRPCPPASAAYGVACSPIKVNLKNPIVKVLKSALFMPSPTPPPPQIRSLTLLFSKPVLLLLFDHSKTLNLIHFV